MTTDNPSLDKLRAEIDRIDDRIHDLIMERTELVEQIAAAKAQDDGVPLRPGREAQIMRRIVGRHSGAFPKASLVRIWREIMGAVVGLQKPFNIGVFQPERGAGYIELARNHFGVAWPMVIHSSPGHIVRLVADRHTSVGIVPMPIENESDPWWLSLASGAGNLPRIVTRLPVVPCERVECMDAFVIACRPHERSGDDRTLIAIETVADVSRDRMRALIVAAKLEPTVMMATHRGDDTWLHLIEVAGYVEQGDAPVKDLLAGSTDTILHATVIGGYAVQLSA